MKNEIIFEIVLIALVGIAFGATTGWFVGNIDRVVYEMQIQELRTELQECHDEVIYER
jgi:hypothetical protein